MVEEFKFLSSTGKEIYAKKWTQGGMESHRGVIQIVHGMQEHIGRYEEFANTAIQYGYVVIGYDQIGHGKTAKQEEDLGYFDKKDGWNRLVEDIHILQNKIKEEYPNLPYTIFGHSMGSLLVRTYLTKYNDDIAGAIISGTSGQKKSLILGQILTKAIIFLYGEKHRSRLLEYLITGSFSNKYRENSEIQNQWEDIYNNEEVKTEKDPKCGFNFTARGYLDLLKGTYYLTKQKNINKTKNVPMYLFSGDKDPVGDMGKGVIRVHDMLQRAGLTNLSIQLFQDVKHDWMNDIDKQKVYFYLLKWIEETIINK